MRILVVEDQPKMAAFIRKALQAEGFAVDVLRDGEEALGCIGITPFDVVVLDIMLPGRDGLSMLRMLRERQNTVPVMLLSARGHVNERIEGLNAGADDYLPKPFELGEMVARVRALGRRGGGKTGAVILRLADLEVDTLRREANRGGRRIELSAREYRLVEYLLSSPGTVRSRMQILEKVWDYTFDPGSNVVDVYIGRLREKLDAEHGRKLIHSIRGVGYVMKAEP